MSQMELVKVLTDLQELRRLQEELEAEITALQDRIKAHMGDCERLTAGQYKVSWVPVESSRIDTTALKKALPDVAERFTKKTTVRRFMVN